MGFKARGESTSEPANDSLKNDASGMLAASHRRQEEELRACRQAAFALSEDRGRAEHVAIIAAGLRFFRKQAKRHVADEEESVFPRLAGQGEQIDELVRTLIADHREHEKLLGELDALAAPWIEGSALPPSGTAHEFADRFQTFYEHYRDHIDREDDELLPALASLSGEAGEAALAEMLERRPNRG